MEINDDFAEILGMFAADGCLQNSYICMWGNIGEDRDYYDFVVCPLFSKVFERKLVAHEKKSNSVYGFYLCSKEVVQLFRNLGFSNNKTYTVKVPDPILQGNESLKSAFIRGFADCDGSISFMRRKGKYRQFKLKFNTYPRILIKVVSPFIIKDISDMLTELGINHTREIVKSRKQNEREAYQISIRGKERVEKWIEKVGFNNPSQHTKYLIWKKFDMCPPQTTIEERKAILKGELDPFSLYERNAPDRI